MEFKDPWLIALIPFVFILFLFLKRRQKEPTIRFPSTKLLMGSGTSWKIRIRQLPFILRLIVVTLFILALAGPRKILEETKRQTEGIDIILAIDCSGSMAAEDFMLQGRRYNRLYVIKEAVKGFVDGRKSDRLGLIAFAALAYTVSPLTMDHNWLLTNLERIELGLIKDGTAIGSGISSSLARLKNSKAKSKVIVLLTDGINNTGKIQPLPAAQMAKTLGVKIYTIGAGTKGYAPFPVTDVFGRKFYQEVKIDIDEVTLKKIAEMTGGLYFRATDTDSLREIYKQIDTLEKTKFEEIGFKEYKELFNVFLVSALAILLIEIFLNQTVLLRIP